MSSKLDWALVLLNVGLALVLLVLIVLHGWACETLKALGVVGVTANVAPPHLVSPRQWGRS